jgi:uncharacterized protein (TIGR02147 family)
MSNRARNYRTVLKDELVARQERNPRYSLRAFARDLAMSPARLSEVMNGTGRLSPTRAAGVAARLTLSVAEREWFTALVELESPYPSARKRGKARARGLKKQLSYTLMDKEAIDVVADWRNVALLELIGLEAFAGAPERMAAALGMSAEELGKALARLELLGLVRRVSGRWERTTAKLTTSSPIPSQVIRSFHRQMLAKAERALDGQALPRRSFDSLIFAVAAADVEPAKAALAEFARDFTRRFRASPEGKDRVYALCLQLFDALEDRP